MYIKWNISRNPIPFPINYYLHRANSVKEVIFTFSTAFFWVPCTMSINEVSMSNDRMGMLSKYQIPSTTSISNNRYAICSLSFMKENFIHFMKMMCAHFYSLSSWPFDCVQSIVKITKILIHQSKIVRTFSRKRINLLQSIA